MTDEIWTFRIGSFSFHVQRSAIVGTVLLGSVFTWAAWGLLQLSLAAALQFGLLATIAHWALEVIHQLGHAWAAKRTGYPMRGLRFWWALSTTLYPGDEPELPDRVHVQRALGGPTMSFVVSILAAVWTWWIWPPQGVSGWLAVFVLLDNLLTFTLGAFLPLGFTDGSTLLRLWRRRG